MFRDDAHKMLQLMAQFQSEGIPTKVVDLDVERAKVELQFESGDKVWLQLWEAAKVIEALS